MNTERLTAIALLVVAVVALGGVAATLDAGPISGGYIGEEGESLDPTDENGSSPEQREPPPPTGRESEPEQSGSDGSAAVSLPSFWTPAIWVLAGATLLGLAGVIAVQFVRGDTAAPAETGGDEEEEESVDLDRVGRAAGAAADRIERQADASNEVFRAWREMVDLLRIDDPETTTPAEFEARAVAAGMDADAVATLTQLFGEVRYGEFEAAEREGAAVAALRRIEREHAADEEGEQP